MREHTVSGMAARLNILLQRNEDWARTLTLTDFAGLPLDLSGCVVEMQVREKLSQSLVATAAVEIISAPAGLIAVTLRASEGTPLGQYGSGIQASNLHYDLRMTDAAGTKLVLIAGIIILSRGETRS